MTTIRSIILSGAAMLASPASVHGLTLSRTDKPVSFDDLARTLEEPAEPQPIIVQNFNDFIKGAENAGSDNVERSQKATAQITQGAYREPVCSLEGIQVLNPLVATKLDTIQEEEEEEELTESDIRELQQLAGNDVQGLLEKSSSQEDQIHTCKFADFVDPRKMAPFTFAELDQEIKRLNKLGFLYSKKALAEEKYLEKIGIAGRTSSAFDKVTDTAGHPVIEMYSQDGNDVDLPVSRVANSGVDALEADLAPTQLPENSTGRAFGDDLTNADEGSNVTDSDVAGEADTLLSKPSTLSSRRFLGNRNASH